MVDIRRDFFLPEDDIEYLDSKSLKWEAIQHENDRAVVWYNFPFPEIFKPNVIDLKIKVPADYSSGAALDMFFTSEFVTRTDGLQIPKLTKASQFDGKQWWQWSRHYPCNVSWRPGINSLVTHICYVQNILEQEAKGKSWG